MFWTIVAALVFFFYGIPLILGLLTSKSFWKFTGFLALALIALMIVTALQHRDDQASEPCTPPSCLTPQQFNKPTSSPPQYQQSSNQTETPDQFFGSAGGQVQVHPWHPTSSQSGI